MEKRPLVVGVVGSHCTGKTSLLSLLKETLEKKGIRVAVLEEVVRRVERGKLGTLEGQKRIFSELKRELERLTKKPGEHEVIITDRSFLDVVVYTLYYASTRGWSENECKNSLELIRKCMEEQAKFYDLLVYADNVGRLPIVDDGFRLTDEHSRLAVDTIFKSLLNLMGERKVVWWELGKEEEVGRKILEAVGSGE